MKILFLSPWFPFPPDNGIKTRLYHLIRCLSQQHEVTLLSFVRAEERIIPDGLTKLCRTIKTIPWHAYAPTHWRAIAGFFSPTPRAVAYSYSQAMEHAVCQTDSQTTYDVVIASTTDTAAYAGLSHARVRLLEEHNFMTGWMQDNYHLQTNLVKRARHWLTFWKYRNYETRLYRSFDVITMVSEDDAQAARSLLPNVPPIYIVPNGVDIQYFEPNGFHPQPYTLVFNGSLSYSANLEAMRFFCQAIFPRIQTAIPHVQLAITGNADPSIIDEFAHYGVHLTGFLDDIRPTISSSWACVTPLLHGRGTRLKILQAMALGTPVISTRKGAEGLNVVDGEHILISDDPAEFAWRTIALLNDEQLRARLSSNARRLVTRLYDWNALGTRFENVLKENAN